MNRRQHLKALVAMVVVVGFAMTSSVLAELWPPLDEYVSKCVLIVKARAVGDADKDGMCSFEVLETWKGRFDPAGFAPGVADGNVLRARQGEHGGKVTRAQEIILFYTRQNQPDEKLHTHSTAFPVNGGRIIYAATSNGLREEMTVEAFRQRMTPVAASTQPARGPTTKSAARLRE